MKVPNVSVQQHMSLPSFKRRLVLAMADAQAVADTFGYTYGSSFIMLRSAYSQLVMTAFTDGTFTVFDQQDQDWTPVCAAILGGK